ncbi:protein translocase subunit SecD [candidate division KSB1 bacterium]|nr:MAG: protein translocase subunit SecD [candidate division KSB1 bacterium]
MRRKNTFRWIIIFLAVFFALYYLYPTYKVETYTQEDRNNPALVGKITELEKKAIKRGLDLKGGMHLVLEVDLPKLVENLASVKDEKFYQLLSEAIKVEKETKGDFLDIFGKLANEKKIKLNRYFESERRAGKNAIDYLKNEAKDAVDKALQILRSRVNQFGVSEPSIQKEGSRRIIVELPGIQNINRARELIGKTARLEFRLLKDPEVVNSVIKDINNLLKRQRNKAKGIKEDTTKLAEAKIDSTDTTKVEAKKPSKDEEISLAELFGSKEALDNTQMDTTGDTTVVVDAQTFGEDPFLALLRNLSSYGGSIGVPEKNVPAVKTILNMPEVKKLIPKDATFVWSYAPVYTDPSGTGYYELLLVKKDAELDGSVITNAQADIGSGYSPTSAGMPIVTMSMNSYGSRIWSRVTSANVGKRIAILLDDQVYSAPVVRTRIADGRSSIEGMSNMDEAKLLAIVLRAGAFRAPVQIIEERTVGPSLGVDSIKKGTWSAIIGFVMVIAFMILYYRFSGIIANVALLLNIIFVLAILAGFHATLTLPGIAGIILTIGMAVDANVLIFERIREELRTGKTIRASIDAGYSRAFRTILDANVTTLITAIVLYQFGTGAIKGFGVTLSIGIIASMFTAIVVTRVIFDFITAHFALRKLSI